jgi:hypothetical protein
MASEQIVEGEIRCSVPAHAHLFHEWLHQNAQRHAGRALEDPPE